MGHSPEGERVAEARAVLKTINSATECNGILPPSVFNHCCLERVCKVSSTPMAFGAEVGVRLGRSLGWGSGKYGAACRPTAECFPPGHNGVCRYRSCLMATCGAGNIPRRFSVG